MVRMSDLPLDGTVRPEFEPVREVFAEVLAEHPGTGAAVAVWHGGAWAVDLWGGTPTPPAPARGNGTAWSCPTR